MRLRTLNWLTLLTFAAASGCSRQSAETAFVSTPVYGTITLDGQPLEGALVTFVSSEGPGAFMGRTSSDGTYHLEAAARPSAVCQGRYRVAVSKPVKSDGSPLSADEPPMLHPGREVVPARYLLSAYTPLEALVGAEGGRFDFALTSQ